MSYTEPLRIPFRGNSMWPFLRDGDFLIVDCNVSKLKLGDVGLFYRENELFAHRVVSIENNVLIKGDRNLNLDLNPSLLGVLKARERNEKISNWNSDTYIASVLAKLSWAHYCFREHYFIRNLFTLLIIVLGQLSFINSKKLMKVVTH